MAEKKQTQQLPIVVALACLLIGIVLGWSLRPTFEQVLNTTTPSGIEQPATDPTPGTDPATTPDNNQGTEPSTDPGTEPSTDPGTNQGTTTDPSGTEVKPGTTKWDDLIWDGDDKVTDPNTGATVEFDGEYTSRDEVALYIYAFGGVPDNFITKTKARNAGWVNTEGNLWDVLPGMSIGGGGFDNNEGELPLEYDPDRTFKECDINYAGGYRGAERLVYSDDGYIFYTGDHYETFTLLYGPEE